MNDDDKPASPEELQAAMLLAAALESDQTKSAGEHATAGLIRAAAGHAAPLGELRARALVREGRALVPESGKARRRPRRRWTVAVPLLAVAVLLILLTRGRNPVPERLRSRSAGLLVPGPFPTRQTAAQRLDRVTSDRLIALREVRCRAVSRGAP